MEELAFNVTQLHILLVCILVHFIRTVGAIL